MAKPKIDSALISKIEVEPENNSKIFDTICAVTGKFKDCPNQRRVMLVFSDGRDQQSRNSKELAIKSVESANVSMYSIGIMIMGGASLSALDAISQKTGGHYYFASRSSQIPGFLNSITKTIMQGYVVSFSVNGIAADDDFHQLTMKVSNEGQDAKAARNILAKKIPVPLWLKIVFIILIILALAFLVLLLIFRRRERRKKMGINKRKCPACKAFMKDEWEFCPFCKWLPIKLPTKKIKE